MWGTPEAPQRKPTLGKVPADGVASVLPSITDTRRSVDLNQNQKPSAPCGVFSDNSRGLQSIFTEKRIPFLIVSGYPTVLVLPNPVSADDFCVGLNLVSDGGH
jgi:hypothetical protein